MSQLTNCAKLGLIIASTVLEAIRSQLIDSGDAIQFKISGDVMGELIDSDLREHIEPRADLTDVSNTIHAFVKEFCTSPLFMVALVKEDWELLIFAIAGRVVTVLKLAEVKVKPITWGNGTTVPSTARR